MQSESCPRCLTVPLNPDKAMNALSRRDNKTYICSQCGLAEALADFDQARRGSS